MTEEEWYRRLMAQARIMDALRQKAAPQIRAELRDVLMCWEWKLSPFIERVDQYEKDMLEKNTDRDMSHVHWYAEGLRDAARHMHKCAAEYLQYRHDHGRLADKPTACLRLVVDNDVQSNAAESET